MKKVLLLYLFHRSGHHRASKALQVAFSSYFRNIETVALETFGSLDRRLEPRIRQLYDGVLKSGPFVWGWAYDRPGVERVIRKVGPVFFRIFQKKFCAIIKKTRPDAIICTQAFPSMLASAYKALISPALPLFAVVTDLHPNGYWVNSGIDLYFVPGRHAAGVLQGRGIGAHRIRDHGIPVDPGLDGGLFDPREYRKKIGLNPHMDHVLVMGGSRGHIPALELLKLLDEHGPFQITFIVGENVSLRRELERAVPGVKNPTRILGYVDPISDYYKSASVLLTKCGGLTTAEALALGVPTVGLANLPGQEAWNARILERESEFRVAKTNREAVSEVLRILKNPRGSAAPRPRAAAQNIALEVSRFL